MGLAVQHETLAVRTCACCSKPAEEVINTATNVRVGWYCPACKGFEAAIGRERVWRDEKESSQSEGAK